MIAMEQGMGLAVAIVILVLGIAAWIGAHEIITRARASEPLERQRERMARRFPMIHVVFPDHEDRDLYDQDKDMSVHGPAQN